MDITKLICPSCSGKVEFDELTGKMHCNYCNSEFIIERPKKESKIDYLTLTTTYIDSGEFKLADEYVNKLIEQNPESGSAWFLKAIIAMLIFYGWPLSSDYHNVNWDKYYNNMNNINNYLKLTVKYRYFSNSKVIRPSKQISNLIMHHLKHRELTNFKDDQTSKLLFDYANSAKAL